MPISRQMRRRILHTTTAPSRRAAVLGLSGWAWLQKQAVEDPTATMRRAVRAYPRRSVGTASPETRRVFEEQPGTSTCPRDEATRCNEANGRAASPDSEEATRHTQIPNQVGRQRGYQTPG